MPRSVKNTCFCYIENEGVRQCLTPFFIAKIPLESLLG